MANLIGESADANVPGILGENTALTSGGGVGVRGNGTGANGTGVFGSGDAVCVRAEGIGGGSAILATCQQNDVIVGIGKFGMGVFGQSETGSGVRGVSGVAAGISGSEISSGVRGESSNNFGHGVTGVNTSINSSGFLAGRDSQFQQHAGVYGESDQQGVMGLTTVAKGTGVYGGGTTAARGDQIGVRGETQGGVGVQGESFGEGVAIQGISLSGNQGLAGRFIGNVHIQGNPGTSSGDLRVEGTSSFGGNVEVTSNENDAVVGFATAPGKAGVLGLAPNGNALAGISDNATGLFAKGPLFAGIFQGNVDVSGNISCAQDIILTNADCAEDFDIAGAALIEPGTVMVLDQDGALQQSELAYDKRVAGVISGAGDLRPGLILGRQASQGNRVPIALLGKVYCKVDAQYSLIEVGDLLTTSPTPGHAMKAADQLKAFGSVIGKALQPMQSGQGMISILVALQ